MSNNTYRAPANELGEGGHTDTALAVSIAAMEQQQQQRRQQEAQRQVYNPQQQVDSSSDFARRQAYQSAQRLAPLQQGRTSQHGMTGGAPALVGPQSVPDQSSTHQRNTRSSQPRTAGYSELQVNDLNNMQHPKRTSEHRRSASSGLPPVYYDTDPTVANRNHQRSISHDAALPAIRTESDSTTDAVGHVTDSLPLPTSPLTGTRCYSPNMSPSYKPFEQFSGPFTVKRIPARVLGNYCWVGRISRRRSLLASSE